MKVKKRNTYYPVQVIRREVETGESKKFYSFGNIQAINNPERMAKFEVDDSTDFHKLMSISRFDDDALKVGGFYFIVRDEDVYFEEIYEHRIEVIEGKLKIIIDEKVVEANLENVKHFLQLFDGCIASDDYRDFNNHQNQVDYVNLLAFLDSYMMDSYVYNLLYDSGIISGHTFSRYDSKKYNTSLVNLFYLFFLIDEYVLENLIKAGLGSLLKQAYRGEITIESIVGDGTSTSDILGVPQWAINNLGELGLTENAKSIETLKNIYEKVGSDHLKIFFKWIENLTSMEKLYKFKVVSFFEHIEKLLNADEEYNLNKLYGWTMRNMFAMHMDANRLLGYLFDYIHMCVEMKIEPDLYPSNVCHYHDRLQERYKVFKNEYQNRQFAERCEVYSELLDAMPIHERFTIIAPTDASDLAREGESLNHCVGSYSKHVISGSSKIFFLREKENEEKPYVTIELGKDNKLKQCRGRKNMDPISDVKNMVNEWVANIEASKTKDEIFLEWEEEQRRLEEVKRKLEEEAKLEKENKKRGEDKIKYVS